ncbi:TRAP transporter small permease [Marinibaculum pumilum]|uniref:TRAP transporter small permease protein n=1 Tax=Marinibaculum pumilum TaxID=1766165 RepID=A0ABV7KVG2_9PROT
MTLLGRILSWAVTASTMVGAVAVILMMLQIVADVLLKNILSWPLPLTSIFVANYYMVIAAYLPLALTEKLARHISVEILFRYLSARWQRWVGGTVCLFAGIVAAGIAWELWFEAMKRARAGTFIVEQSIVMPIWPTYFVLPVGFGLLALVLFYRFAGTVTGLAGGLGEVPLDDDSIPGEQAGDSHAGR